MHAWLSRMGISAGGKNYKLVGEQARRISACRLTFLTEVPRTELRHKGAFVQNAITLMNSSDQRQPALRQDRVRLDDGLWAPTRERPLPGCHIANVAVLPAASTACLRQNHQVADRRPQPRRLSP